MSQKSYFIQQTKRTNEGKGQNIKSGVIKLTFSDFDLSILGEIGNVSVGGAATSLSDFVNKLVMISIPDTKIMKFKELKKYFEPAVVYAKVDYTNEFKGSNILLMKSDEAKKFSQIIIEEKLGKREFEWNDFSKNVITEAFNIMVGHMSASMSELFQKGVNIQPPELLEMSASELDLFDDEEEFVSIWFEIRIEDHLKIRLMKILSIEQAKEMIALVKRGI